MTELLRAKAIAQEIANSPLHLEEKLEWHFSLFEGQKPTKIVFPMCLKALFLAKNGGDMETLIDLPTGMFYRNEPRMTAQQVIKEFHLSQLV
jgi:hypothetical protein